MYYVIVDIETTGGSPKSSKVTEIAMYKSDGRQVIDEYVTLVNPEQKIPEFIVRLTGINDKMVETAPKFYEIAKKIIEFTEDAVFVAHNVAFDYGVLRYEFKNLGFDFRKAHLCTVRSARYIIPGHTSYSLGKLSRALGIQVIGRHRAGGDALATTELFHLLHAKGEKNIQKFVQEDLNPKMLHPNLDLEMLEEIPSKAGVYSFYNEANQLIYIGKSKHIRKRIDQHLRNASTKKAIEMQQEICRIEFRLTGSELIALLLESQLIKTHKPLYNRMLRKELFPYGLYTFTNEQGYEQFYIDRVSKRLEQPLTTFGSKPEAVSYLTQQVKKYNLCQKLANLYPTQSACFDYQIKQCFGACIGKEKPETYNARVRLLIEQINFDWENFYILDKGIERNERSIVMIEHGMYRGYGKIPYYALKKSPKKWNQYIEEYHEDKDTRMIISQYLRKNAEVDIVIY